VASLLDEHGALSQQYDETSHIRRHLPMTELRATINNLLSEINGLLKETRVRVIQHHSQIKTSSYLRQRLKPVALATMIHVPPGMKRETSQSITCPMVRAQVHPPWPDADDALRDTLVCLVYYQLVAAVWRRSGGVIGPLFGR
jgi:hypothetical protein